MTSSTTLTRELKDLLGRSRNADGGWGYYAGKTSRLEPTCWALLALGGDVDDDVLRRWPAVDGLLLEQAAGTPNFGFHGLALITLLHRGIQHRSGNSALLSGIQRVKGTALKNNEFFRQDNRLQGWSWTDGTFSWVEPTAYCLLALKRAVKAKAPVDAQRVRDAEALLFDRCCATGGWNYGNSNAFGRDLSAYVPTTSLALLALQDCSSEAAFKLSLSYLKKEALSESSSIALSLALIALRAVGASVTHLGPALERQLPTTLALGSQHAIAMALFALRTDHVDAAFTL